jgi:hypothetical protein
MFGRRADCSNSSTERPHQKENFQNKDSQTTDVCHFHRTSDDATGKNNTKSVPRSELDRYARKHLHKSHFHQRRSQT